MRAYVQVAAVLAMVTVVSAAVCRAEDDAQRNDEKKAAAKQLFEERYGRNFRKPGTGTGSTGFVIVGNAVDEAEVAAVVKAIGQQLKQRSGEHIPRRAHIAFNVKRFHSTMLSI